jgi:uncharacterized membrane protein YfcA
VITGALPFLAVLAAGAMTGVTGFGFSVVAAPLLTLSHQPHEIVPVVLCLVPVTSVALLANPRVLRLVQPRLCVALTATSLEGLPFGVHLLYRLNPVRLTAAIGSALIAFAAFSRFAPEDARVPSGLFLPSAFLGGLLATSTSLCGPIVALYLHGRRMPHDELAATMAAYVAMVSAGGAVIFVLLGGHFTAATGGHVLALMPMVLAGVILGRWWVRKQSRSIQLQSVYAVGLMGVVTLPRTAIVG